MRCSMGDRSQVLWCVEVKANTRVAVHGQTEVAGERRAITQASEVIRCAFEKRWHVAKRSKKGIC
jgi:hypothetical protein